MNRNTLNTPNIANTPTEKAAKYEAAHAKTEAKREEIRAKLAQKKQFISEAKDGQAVLDEVKAWFEQKGMTQESFENSVYQEFIDLNIDPNGMSSEDFATFLAHTDFTLQKEFSDDHTTGYEAAGSLSIFVNDLKKFKSLHLDQMSQIDDTLVSLEKEKLEAKINHQASLMIDLIQNIQSSEDGRLIIFPTDLPYEEHYLAVGKNGEWLESAPKLEVSLNQDKSKIVVVKDNIG
jgi:hypothetical protein